MRETELIVALDFAGAEEALAMADRLAGVVRLQKVGLELFTAEGPALVRALQERGFRIFLDLKLHDIPNTVAGAAAAAARLGVELLTVHASGGARMIEAARRAVEGSETRILGVTVLTSLSGTELDTSWGRTGVNPEREVTRLAALALDAGAHGLVSSPREVGALRRGFPEAYLVTPGIRLPGEGVGDQVRTTGPDEAARAGADALVVGRSVTKADDPRAAAIRILQSMKTGATVP